MATNRILRSWRHRTPAFLIPIVLIGSLPLFAQSDTGVLKMTINGKPVSAIQWTGIDRDEPRIKVFFGQPARKAAHRHIVVSIPDKQVYLVKNGKIIRQYSAILGDVNEPTPTGEFRITEHIPWNSEVIGKVWIGFHNIPKTDVSYGIHGRGPQHDERYTSGCVALNNDDVADLYRRVAKGDRVTIIATRGPSSAPPRVARRRPTQHTSRQLVALTNTH